MRKILRIILVVIALLSLVVLYQFQSNYGKQRDEFRFHESLTKSIKLNSQAFEDGGTIPVEFTGKGENISPPLNWENLPEGTRSVAIIVTDYDAPSPLLRLFTVGHWILYNIPHNINFIEKGIKAGTLDSLHITVGKNISGKRDYIGPNPPLGTHQYYFRIYALDLGSLYLKNDNREQLLQALKGHILGYGELVGRF